MSLAAQPEALVPEYEIEALLGSGASGTTYIARTAGSGALLAVKILALGGDAGDVAAAAGSIGAALTGFRHPDIARTYAIDVEADSTVRLVRDYIPGRPLLSWLGQADGRARTQAFETVATALATAHSHGLFHGHVVASNVIIAAGGRPVLVDLGAHPALRALQGRSLSVAEMAEEDRAALEALHLTFGSPA